MRFLAVLIMLISLTACGSGGGGSQGGSPSAGLQSTTLFYASGRIKAQGEVIAGSQERTGTWTIYFDAAGSPKQFVGDYQHDVLDAQRPWTEWNQDGSLRADAGDR